MKTRVAALFVVSTMAFGAAAGPAFSQLTPPPATFGSYADAFSAGDTPTMRRDKLKQALALRAEALRLQEADGGVLSPEHAAYVRGRAAAIMGQPTPPATGSLIRKK